MATIGAPNDVFCPRVLLFGGNADREVAGFTIDYPIGQIATGSVSIPPEEIGSFFSGDAEEPMRLKVEDRTLFSGYNAGPTGSGTGDSFNFGLALIHRAVELDQGRLFSPGSHPLSTDDYTFSRSTGGTDSMRTIEGDLRNQSFDINANIGDEVKRYLTEAMSNLRQESSFGLPQLEDMERATKEQNARVLEALGRIKSIGACKLAFGGTAGPGMSLAAAEFMNKLIMNSLTSQKSAWDLLAMAYAAFGMNLICLPDGSLKVAPDFAGCRPPEQNTIKGTIHTGFEAQSSYSRSPAMCVVLAHGLQVGDSGFGGDEEKPPSKEYSVPLGSFAPKKIKRFRGGAFVTGLPAWMVPTQQTGQIPEIDGEIIRNYAKQMYYEVSNMGRTFVVTTPLNDEARPGTTYWFEPTSSAVFFSGGDLPFSPRYAGFCHRISHSASSTGNNFYTHFHFRNIYSPDEFDDMIPGAAFFSDQPAFKLTEAK